MYKSSISIRVKKKQGEKAILLVSKLGLLDKSMNIERDKTHIYIPIIRQPEENQLETLRNVIPELQLTMSFFIEKKPHTKTLIQILQHQLSPDLLSILPQAFDIIGDIAIIEIPKELKLQETLIGKAILKTHKNLRTVLAKVGNIRGTYRTGEYAFIAGIQKTRTIHKEFGCQYHVDVAKVYFSPRLSHEHERIASLVQTDETIVDLFAGVGPFSVLIGKKNPKAKVYAVDLNPEAIDLLKINVRVNRVENSVIPILADAREITATKLNGSADRVIMNLPETSIDFVDTACNAIKSRGGIVHFYAFLRSPSTIDDLKQRFSQAVEENGRKVESYLYAKSIRETAPFKFQIALDAKII